MENLAPFVGQIYFGEGGEGSLGSPLVIRAGNYESSSSHSTYTTQSSESAYMHLFQEHWQNCTVRTPHSPPQCSTQRVLRAFLVQEHWQNHLRMSENSSSSSLQLISRSYLMRINICGFSLNPSLLSPLNSQ